MNLNRLFLFAAVALSMCLAGCKTAPRSADDRAELVSESEASLKKLNFEDPGLQAFLDRSYGYVIFPSAGKGGLIVGGAYGRGTVYEQSVFVGYADISQATVGAQIGGQSFAEVIAFENKPAMDRFKAGQLKFTAEASAVILKSGAAAAAKYTDGVAIFVKPLAGAMAAATVGGQSFVPAEVAA